MQPRIEKKLTITPEVYQELSLFFSFLFQRDKNTPNDQKHYDVLSLYYESEDDSFFYEKMDGDFEHNKIRLRSYSKSFEGKFFLEHKYKKGDHLIKIKSSLLNVNDTNPAASYSNITDLKTREYFQYLFQKKDLRPKTFVYYKREAYESSLDEQNIRVNFDYDLKFTPFNGSFLFNQNSLIRSNSIILEIKSDKYELPSIIKEKLRSLNLNWNSFSKYAEARININIT